MTPELVIGLVTGQGAALVVLLLWIRMIVRDRDFYRSIAFRNLEMAEAAVTRLEATPTPNGPGSPLRAVE